MTYTSLNYTPNYPMCRLNYSHFEYKSEFGRNKPEATEICKYGVYYMSGLHRKCQEWEQMISKNYQISKCYKASLSRKAFEDFFLIRGYSILTWNLIESLEIETLNLTYSRPQSTNHGLISWPILCLLSILIHSHNSAVIIQFCLWLKELYFKYYNTLIF